MADIIRVLIQWAVSASALLVTAYLVRGFEVKSFFSALFAAVIIGLGNIIIWPILFFLTLPLNVLTLGLFTFVVNGIVLKICSAFIPGFKIQTWGAAIFGAIVLSFVGTVFSFIGSGFLN